MKKELTYHERFTEFYNSNKWHKLRKAIFIRDSGLCQHCLKKGIYKAGREVHHILDIEHHWEHRFDEDNLILLCNDCHNAMHNRESPLQEFLKEWEKIGGKENENKIK